MMLLRSLALGLLVCFLEQQVSLSSAVRRADRTSGRAQRKGDKSPATARGKFSTSDKLQCVWDGREDGEMVKLRITCQHPKELTASSVATMECEYNAKPQSCPGYQSDTKGFWRQVGRALKKIESTMCRSEMSLVKTGMCKRAPSAHFKLDVKTSRIINQFGGPGTVTQTPPPLRTSSVGPTVCAKRADHRKSAEEYCGSSWASLCSFFLSMLQSDDC